MKLALTSDLHGVLPAAEYMVPDAEVLVIAGDIAPDYLKARYVGSGEPRWGDKGAVRQANWFETHFCKWIDMMPHEKVVMIGGNHDFFLDHPRTPTFLEPLPDKVTYLSVGDPRFPGHAIVAGINFAGIAWVPNLPFWAFHGDSSHLSEVYGRVMADTEILVTHGPPFGVCDRVVMGENVGSMECLDAIQRVQPHVVVTGHIHEAYGVGRIPGSTRDSEVWNVSLNDERYAPRLSGAVELEL